MTGREETIVVTGASRGIGRAIAEDLLDRGYAVVGVGRRLDALHAVAAESDHGERFQAYEMDISDAQSVAAFWASLASDGARVTGLVNNAGISPHGRAEELDAAQLEAVMDVNVLALYRCSIGALPLLQRNGGGSIVNLASVNSHVAVPQMAAYTASKFAVRGLTQNLAVEWARHGVRVNSVSPGVIATDMTEHMAPGTRAGDYFLKKIPMRRYGTCAEVADAVAFLLSDRSTYITGSDLKVDGGMTA